MDEKKRVAFIAFGEVNTPMEMILRKHDEALAALNFPDTEVLDAGVVIDDEKYETAGCALQKLEGKRFDVLLCCICGWIPSHAVIKVTDEYRHLPMLLWGLCGFEEDGRIVTTAEQAGTSALRAVFEGMGYRFRFVYNTIGEPMPLNSICNYIYAAYAAREIRHLRVGTMGYRDMLLYGTQFEGISLRAKIGVEVEPFELYEMVCNAENLSTGKVMEYVGFVKRDWVFKNQVKNSVIEQGVKYALAIGKKIDERGYSAVTLIDVDGMKKLLGFPPAMVFMLLDEIYGVQTIPENDIPGSVTQLIARLLTGETAAYLEYYEFFKNSLLAGVPDFIPKAVCDGEVTVMSQAFGLLSESLLNISKVKEGRLTCARLLYADGKYKMHLYTGEGRRPPKWEEYGWTPPAPQLPSLEIFPDVPVKDLAQKIGSQHVIITYGDNRELFEDFCGIVGIEVI